MNNKDDLLKNYIESQKRQQEILEETKKRRLKNKNNAEQTKNISQYTKDESKNDLDQALGVTEIKRTANNYMKREDKNIINQNQRLLNPKKVKGKYLGVVNDQLSKKYSKDEIAIACGYFEIKNKMKVPLVEEYLAESSKSVEQFVQLQNKCSTEDYYLTRIDLGIFKERLYEDDGEEHGRDIYIPKRIVENSQDWNYKTSDFEDFDMEYVENEDGLEFFESYIAEKYTEEELKRLDKEKEFLKFYGFSEPMMIKSFSYVLFYIDHHLKINNNESFEDEDIAEAQGIRYSDIQEIPHDSPYFSF